MQEEHYEFSRDIVDRQPVQADGTILPTRRFDVRRRDDPDEPFKTLGWVEVALRPVKNPPDGHAAVAVIFTASVNLTEAREPWDGTERRGRR